MVILKRLSQNNSSLLQFVCGGSLTSCQLVKGSLQISQGNVEFKEPPYKTYVHYLKTFLVLVLRLN